MHCAVLGDPIAHSLSPVLHRAGYVARGLDWTYDAHRVPQGGLADFVAGLDDTWRGLSLTMPLKREALALATEVTDRARLAGAGNTLLLDGDRLGVDNTDLPGAVAAIRERWDGVVSSATIIGAGATAASTALALAELGAGAIRLLARNAERAAATVGAIAAHPAAPSVEVVGFDADVTGEVVVSTIPVGAQDAGLLGRCATPEVVFEVVYTEWPTPLARAAAERGQVVVGGLDLLVHQAALQFEMFTGHPAPLAAMRAAGEQALAERA